MERDVLLGDLCAYGTTEELLISREKIIKIFSHEFKVGSFVESETNATEITAGIDGDQGISDTTDHSGYSEKSSGELVGGEETVGFYYCHLDVETGYELADRSYFVEPIATGFLCTLWHHVGGEVVGETFQDFAAGSRKYLLLKGNFYFLNLKVTFL